MTFDDGPSNYDSRILSALRQCGVPATFFVIGRSELAGTYKRIVDESHSLGLHSFSHVYSDCYASSDAFFAEIYRLQDLIEGAAGIRPMIFPCPGGSNNTVAKDGVISEILERAGKEGFRTFDWTSRAGNSSPIATLDGSYNYVVTTCHDDVEIILMHKKVFFGDLIRMLVPTLSSRGYMFETLTCDTPEYIVTA